MRRSEYLGAGPGRGEIEWWWYASEEAELEVREGNEDGRTWRTFGFRAVTGAGNTIGPP